MGSEGKKGYRTKAVALLAFSERQAGFTADMVVADTVAEVLATAHFVGLDFVSKVLDIVVQDWHMVAGTGVDIVVQDWHMVADTGVDIERDLYREFGMLHLVLQDLLPTRLFP